MPSPVPHLDRPEEPCSFPSRVPRSLPPLHPQDRRRARDVGNSFRITYICKNAFVTPFGTHTSKTKDLKSRRITYLQKKGRGRGHTSCATRFSVPGHERIYRVPTPCRDQSLPRDVGVFSGRIRGN